MSHAGNDELKEKVLEDRTEWFQMSYNYGDYLLIRNDEVIAVSGNTEFDDVEYVKGDIVARVIFPPENLWRRRLTWTVEDE